MSEFKPNLPPRMTFAHDLAETQDLLFQHSLKSMDVSELAKAALEEFYIIHFKGGNSLVQKNSTLGPNSHPFNSPIMGADQFVLHSLGPFDDESGGMCLNLELFNDGSPWVADEDVEKGGTNHYTVFAAADMPPTAVNSLYFHTLDENGYNARDMATIRDAYQPEVLHPLSDDECEAIMNALRASADNINIRGLHDQISVLELPSEPLA